MPDFSKTFGLSDCRVGTAHQSRFCHCERSEAISLHHSLFLVRHSIFTTTFSFLLLLFNITLPAYAKYGGGTGEPNDPYLIFDANQMNAIGADSNDWDKHFKLMADIDLAGFTGTEFNIIGTDYGNPFTGVFDGNGHTISNFTYTSTGANHIGLFGCVGLSGEVKDLGLIDPNINAGTGETVGSLVGYIGQRGTITNCYAEDGSVAGTHYFVGGLVGWSISGRIVNCYSTSSVSGNYSVGGLVGASEAGTITNCYSTGGVLGTTNVGGLVGYNLGLISNCYSEGDVSGYGGVGGLVGYTRSGRITNCYSNGNVLGYGGVGGLVGWNYRSTIVNCYSRGSVTGENQVGGLVGGNDSSMITNCYSTGIVSGTARIGGLVGYNWEFEVSYSFWDIETSLRINMCGGQGEYGSGCDDGNGKTTAEMQMQITFTDAGWDFTTPIWKVNCEGMSYPKLSWWQPVLGDFDCPDGVDMRDFAILAAQWRQPPGEPSADIAPDSGDGKVDWFDLAALVENWLTGF